MSENNAKNEHFEGDVVFAHSRMTTLERLKRATTASLKTLISRKKLTNPNNGVVESSRSKGKKTFRNFLIELNFLLEQANDFLFPGIPSHYPLKKKLILAKQSSNFGTYWDILQVVLSLIACGLYVSETYTSTFEDQQLYAELELLFTCFFLADFLFNWFTAPNWTIFFSTGLTIVDILTIVPVFIGLALQDTGNANLAIFRFVRILRLARILRSFRLLGGLSGVRRQIITLVLTLMSLIFLAAGIMQLMENDVKMSTFDYECKYVSAKTNWLPSCSPEMPKENITGGCACDVDDLVRLPVYVCEGVRER